MRSWKIKIQQFEVSCFQNITICQHNTKDNASVSSHQHPTFIKHCEKIKCIEVQCSILEIQNILLWF